MSKLSFRARALDASKPMPIYLAEELPDLPDYSAINRAVPQMPSGMEKEEECEHHLQRAICTGLIIPTPEVFAVDDLRFYEACYPPDYKMPKQHIHMQPLWQEQETPEYDIDSEDEKWLKQQRHPELTELKFESWMDKLEKSSGQAAVTLSEARLLLGRGDDLVTAVYDYWLNKRLHTQHPLILTVKTENRLGQSSNNPYLAFRRRTEKMQTRKNRKNDESSYEKMVKLRRELARALSLLELVGRRERAKRELARLTALLAERRFAAGDYADTPPVRPHYAAVPLPNAASFRRDAFTVQPYPPRAPPTPVEQPRLREKRPYKRRKHRHHAAGSGQGLRESGVGTSSDEEATTRADTATPPDDGPYAFRRKQGCFYEMPTTTLIGDPVESQTGLKDALHQHEIDPRHRYTLTSVKWPHPRCVGFARRRVCRGGRVALDRLATPLDALWPRLDFRFTGSGRYRRDRLEEVELETKAHRYPKEMTRDYHTSGKYPWRHTFRRHLARHPELWIDDASGQNDKMALDLISPKLDIFDTALDKKLDFDDIIMDDVREVLNDNKTAMETDTRLSMSDLDLSDIKLSDVTHQKWDGDKIESKCSTDVSSSSAINSDISVSVRERAVTAGLARAVRKRSWSGCSDSSCDSNASLTPVEQEFEKFITEVNRDWLHFRPKTPPPQPASPENPTSPIVADTPIQVELRTNTGLPSSSLDLFTTSEFTLSSIYGDVNPEPSELPTDSLLSDNVTGSIAVDSPAPADKAKKDEVFTSEARDVDGKGNCPFLSNGQNLVGRSSSGHTFGSSVVRVSDGASAAVRTHLARPAPTAAARAADGRPAKPAPARKSVETPRVVKVEQRPVEKSTPSPVAKPATQEPKEAPKAVKKLKENTIEELQVTQGVQIKTIHTKHSPLKKHIITSGGHRRSANAVVTSQDAPPQLLTVAVSDSLKVRLQNHVAATNGPASAQPFALTVPASAQRDPARAGVATAAGALPLNKLKVVHAHALTHAQRALLTQSRTGVTQLPAVVSLATLGEAKAGNATILKAAPGSYAQFFDIKGVQLGKGPHLVNVVRQPQTAKPTVAARIDDPKAKRVIAFDGTVKGNVNVRAQRANVSIDGRLIHAAPAIRPPIRHQIQFKNKTLVARSMSESPSPVALPAQTKATIPTSVVANLLQKNVQMPKKIALAGAGGQLAANLQAIAFTSPQLKQARQGRLVAQPRTTTVAEIVEASTAPVASSSSVDNPALGGELVEGGARGARGADNLPMEVT